MTGAHTCLICQATFTRPQHVVRHARQHTGVKPYPCDLCEERFSRSDLLNRHRGKFHAGEPASVSGHKRARMTSSSMDFESGRTVDRLDPKRACVACSKGKTKCDMRSPCSRCLLRTSKCIYAPLPASSSSSLSSESGPTSSDVPGGIPPSAVSISPRSILQRFPPKSASCSDSISSKTSSYSSSVEPSPPAVFASNLAQRPDMDMFGSPSQSTSFQYRSGMPSPVYAPHLQYLFAAPGLLEASQFKPNGADAESEELTAWSQVAMGHSGRDSALFRQSPDHVLSSSALVADKLDASGFTQPGQMAPPSATTHPGLPATPGLGLSLDFVSSNLNLDFLFQHHHQQQQPPHSRTDSEKSASHAVIESHFMSPSAVRSSLSDQEPGAFSDLDVTNDLWSVWDAMSGPSEAPPALSASNGLAPGPSTAGPPLPPLQSSHSHSSFTLSLPSRYRRSGASHQAAPIDPHHGGRFGLESPLPPPPPPPLQTSAVCPDGDSIDALAVTIQRNAAAFNLGEIGAGVSSALALRRMRMAKRVPVVAVARDG